MVIMAVICHTNPLSKYNLLTGHSIAFEQALCIYDDSSCYAYMVFQICPVPGFSCRLKRMRFKAT